MEQLEKLRKITLGKKQQLNSMHGMQSGLGTHEHKLSNVTNIQMISGQSISF